MIFVFPFVEIENAFTKKKNEKKKAENHVSETSDKFTGPRTPELNLKTQKPSQLSDSHRTKVLTDMGAFLVT